MLLEASTRTGPSTLEVRDRLFPEHCHGLRADPRFRRRGHRAPAAMHRSRGVSTWAGGRQPDRWFLEHPGFRRLPFGLDRESVLPKAQLPRAGADRSNHPVLRRYRVAGGQARRRCRPRAATAPPLGSGSSAFDCGHAEERCAEVVRIVLFHGITMPVISTHARNRCRGIHQR